MKPTKKFTDAQKYYDSLRRGQLFRAKKNKTRSIIDFFGLSKNVENVYFKVTQKHSSDFVQTGRGYTRYYKTYNVWIKPTKGSRYNQSQIMNFEQIKQLLVKLTDKQAKTVNILYGR